MAVSLLRSDIQSGCRGATAGVISWDVPELTGYAESDVRVLILCLGNANGGAGMAGSLTAMEADYTRVIDLIGYYPNTAMWLSKSGHGGVFPGYTLDNTSGGTVSNRVYSTLDLVFRGVQNTLTESDLDGESISVGWDAFTSTGPGLDLIVYNADSDRMSYADVPTGDFTAWGGRASQGSACSLSDSNETTIAWAWREIPASTSMGSVGISTDGPTAAGCYLRALLPLLPYDVLSVNTIAHDNITSINGISAANIDTLNGVTF